MKSQKPWTIAAKGGELEIRLFKMIGEDLWTGGGTTAKQFSDDLKTAGNVRKIRLKISSVGGNIFDGLAIYSELLSHPAEVTCEVIFAASIASVIAMAASKISISRTGFFMIHNPSTVIGGDANALTKMADTLSKVKNSMISAYRRHSTKSVAEIGAMMDSETWLDSKESVAVGFADDIVATDDDDAQAAASSDISRFFQRTPPQIAVRFSGAGDDGDERRRRIQRHRTLELHQMDFDDFRRHTIAMREIEISKMRAEGTPEAERRRKLAQHAAELRPGGPIARITDPDPDTVRRRTMAARTRELGRMREREPAPNFRVVPFF